MGLQCSILGHAFEDAGVEREREEQGSEVITTERELERCRRCGTERVVSESTEVAAVVDASDVGLDDAEDADPGGGTAAPENADGDDTAGGFTGAVERSDAPSSAPEPAPDSEPTSTGTDDDPAPPGPDDGTPPTDDGDLPADDGGSRDPAEEDAEILTDDDAERPPGQWPDDADADAADVGTDTADAGTDTADAAPDLAEPTDTVAAAADESLSGITVPEGEIACPECPFRIEANSGYRAGDPCPDCNAWLEAERNQ